MCLTLWIVCRVDACVGCVYVLMVAVGCLHVAYLLSFAFGGLLGLVFVVWRYLFGVLFVELCGLV